MVDVWPKVRRRGFLARLFCQHKMRTVLYDMRFPCIRVRVCELCGHPTLDHGQCPPARLPTQPRQEQG
jgi:hypothetical protein